MELLERITSDVERSKQTLLEWERHLKTLYEKLLWQIEESKIFEDNSKFMIVCNIIIPIVILLNGFNTLANGMERAVVTDVRQETTIEIQNTVIREDEVVEETIAFVMSTTEPEEMTAENFENAKEETLETQPVVVPTISAYQAGEMYYYTVTEEEKIYMEKLVYVEARGECFEGKVAVAAVPLNRYVSGNPEFDRDSIYDIITQPGAFASISCVSQEMLDSNPECKEAVEAALKGWDPTRVMFENGACFFYAPAHISSGAMQCRQGVPTLVIGNHAFHNEFN